MELVWGNYISSRIWRSFSQSIKLSTKYIQREVSIECWFDRVSVMFVFFLLNLWSSIYSLKRLRKFLSYASDVTLTVQKVQNLTNGTKEKPGVHTDKRHRMTYSQSYLSFLIYYICLYIYQYSFSQKVCILLSGLNYPLAFWSQIQFFQTFIIQEIDSYRSNLSLFLEIICKMKLSIMLACFEILKIFDFQTAYVWFKVKAESIYIMYFRLRNSLQTRAIDYVFLQHST